MHEIWAAPNIVRGLEGKSARVFLPGGKPPETGQLFRNPDMAHALRLDAEQGPDPFYKGQIATAIQHLGGTMTAEDLAGFSPEWVQPISINYRGWRAMNYLPTVTASPNRDAENHEHAASAAARRWRSINMYMFD
jgi:gamma-glutamyltranspeptidase/glutathione hydrolase